MDILIITVIILLFLYFLLTGQYINSLFISLGIFGILLIGGTPQLVGFLRSDSFAQVASFSLSTVPLYILMAQFVMSTRIVEDLYSLAFKLSRGKSSSLGVLTVVVGGLLGAVSGSASATSATMAKITFPELVKKGYSNVFAGSVVAVAGSLSAIIPPSVMIIIYAVAARVSIGEMFIAALIPGVLLLVIFSLILVFYVKFSGHVNEDNDQTIQDVGTPTSRYVIAIVMGALIATAIFGGIFSGLFTPSEAGAVGAFLALIMALLMKKVNLQFFRESLTETVKITVMTMFIIIGASLFARFISLSLLPRKIIGLLEPLQDSPILIVILLMLVYFILFMVVDNIAVILMTTPVVLPIVNEIGVDPIWFGILVMVSCTIGLITPPVGTNVFIVGSVAQVSIEKMFRITVVFSIVASVLVLLLLILFPSLVTWLPSLM